jgi:hypothetical protein
VPHPLGSCLRVPGRSTRHDPLARPLHTDKCGPRGASPYQSKASCRRYAVRLTVPPPSGSGSYRVKHLSAHLCQGQEEEMTVKLDQREWAAAQYLVPCVICHQLAILRSPRGTALPLDLCPDVGQRALVTESIQPPPWTGSGRPAAARTRRRTTRDGRPCPAAAGHRGAGAV